VPPASATEPPAGAPRPNADLTAPPQEPLCRPGAFLAAGDTIPTGHPAPTLDQIMTRVDSMSAALGDVTYAVRLEFVQHGGIAELRKTISNTNALVTELSGVAQVQSKALSATLASLKRTMDAIDSASVDSTMRNMAVASRNLTALTRDLDSATVRVNAILGKLNNGEGTAGLMLNDPGVYNNLRQLLARLDSLTADLKANPKKYLNVKVF
jgi:phospholipid/cholesterol/gamma-HCH transport system substrate-binding protein